MMLAAQLVQQRMHKDVQPGEMHSENLRGTVFEKFIGKGQAKNLFFKVCQPNVQCSITQPH